MTAIRAAVLALGLLAFGFVVGLMVGAILSGGLDETIERRKNKKNDR